ncbi:helix-turn-helix transcriptional regulator [Catellatospora chokoriensis]
MPQSDQRKAEINVSGGQSPTVARLRLRHALRSARESSDYTQEQVANELEWSLSKIIRIENGAVRMTVTDVRALLQLYGVNDASEVSEMETLVRASRQRSWWTEHADLPPRFATFIGLEDGASELSFYNSMLIPGLLQTESYARAVIRTLEPDWAQTRQEEEFVTIRMRRQKHVLGRLDPPRVRVVLEEATLRRVTGGVQVQREQLLHLVALGTRPNICLQVLPFSAGVYTLEPTFVLMGFPFGTTSDVVVYLEMSNALALPSDRGQFLERGEVAAPYQEAFSRITDAAFSEADSLAYIAQVAGELH